MAEVGKFAQGLKGFPTPNTAAGTAAYLLFLFDDPSWSEYVLGACEALGYAYNWYEAGELSPDDAADLFRLIVQQAPYNFIPRLEPQTTSFPPAFQSRFNTSTGGFEVSTDGGTTWTPAPEGDPRNHTLVPPPTGVDAQCDAAERVRNVIAVLVQAIITNLIESGDTAAAVAAFFGILTPFIPGLAVAIEIFTGVLGVVLELGEVVIEAAFDLATFEQILCILFCDLPSPPVVDAARLARIEADMSAQLNPVAALVTNYLLELMGYGGINNIIGAATDTGDCSGCACTWCYEWHSQAELLADSWTPTSGTFWNAGFTAVLSKVSFTWTTDGVGLGGDSGSAIWLSNSFVDRVAFETPLSGSPNPLEWSGAPTTVAGGIAFGLNAASGSGGVVAVASLHLEGTGAMPAWSHGHVC